jgi:death-on-curing protein
VCRASRPPRPHLPAKSGIAAGEWPQDGIAEPDRHTKAAAILHSLGRNHAFVDGNKRAAWLSAGARYWISGLLLDAPDDPAYDLVIAVATGDVDVAAVAGTLAQWVRPQSSQERFVGASH